MADTRKETYQKIMAIVSDDDNFPSIQAERLTNLAKEDGRLFLIFYLLLVALRVMYWRRDAIKYRGKAKTIEENAGMLEALNIEI